VEEKFTTMRVHGKCLGVKCWFGWKALSLEGFFWRGGVERSLASVQKGAKLGKGEMKYEGK